MRWLTPLVLAACYGASPSGEVGGTDSPLAGEAPARPAISEAARLEHAEAVAALLAGDPAPSLRRDLRHRAVSAPAPRVPPQCYIRTDRGDGVVRNPCASCHQASEPPNWMGDPEFQLMYTFPKPVLANPWSNLFIDRSARIAAIPDPAALARARQDNYRDPDGGIRLRRVLSSVPEGWDVDGDLAWSGFVPDAWLRFDARGFDLDPQGAPTGWRTYTWSPRPGFWPTHGSAADALIRLPAVFRQAESGAVDLDVYALNLAILEAAIRRVDVPISETDEAGYAVDLDKDGQIGRATLIKWDWAPLDGRNMAWVGRARVTPEVHPPTSGLFPQGTEFFHSLRYLDVVDGQVRMAPRMKEVRYLRKTTWMTWSQHQQRSEKLAREAEQKPDGLEPIHGDMERGVYTGTGWLAAGFIEDEGGHLRPQTLEELAYCQGCHGGLGVTTDSVFSFARKLDPNTAVAQGWYHWQDHPLRVPDPIRGDGRGVYATELAEARAVDPWGTLVDPRFFDGQGAVRAEAEAALRVDAANLLLPSAERALMLNKIYQTVVEDQSFVRGRDAVHALTEAQVWRSVEDEQPTGVTRVVLADWQRAGAE